jgi:hypothetical protein
MRRSDDGMFNEGPGRSWTHPFFLLLVVLSLMFGAFVVAGRAVRQQQYKQTYNACITDGQKSYYCDAFAREAAR